jgi:hypothetical protein
LNVRTILEVNSSALAHRILILYMLDTTGEVLDKVPNRALPE